MKRYYWIVKFVVLVAVPPEVVMAIRPVPPVGTVAWTCEPSELTVIEVAGILLKVTLVVVEPLRPLPVMVTLCPTGPLDGEKPVMLGQYSELGGRLCVGEVKNVHILDSVPVTQQWGLLASRENVVCPQVNVVTFWLTVVPVHSCGNCCVHLLLPAQY